MKFGILLGAFDLTANVYWLTFKQEVDTETDNNGAKTEDDYDYWDIGATVNLSNGPSAKNLAWTISADVLRQKSDRRHKEGNTTTETTYDDALLFIQPHFDFAIPAFTAQNAQVFLGLNTRVPVIIYDELEEGRSTNDRYDFGLYTAPNILAEMSLNEHFIVYGGASFEWKVIDLELRSIESGADTDDTSVLSTRTGGTSANAGIRFKYDRLILEASIADQLGTSAWSGLIGNFGAFLTF